MSVNIVSQTRRMLFMFGNEDLALVIIPLCYIINSYSRKKRMQVMYTSRKS